MLINGHSSHLKHFTLGRAVTKLAVKLDDTVALHSVDGGKNLVLCDDDDDEFDDVSTMALFVGDNDDADDGVVDVDDDAADSDADDRCVGDESLEILWLDVAVATTVCDWLALSISDLIGGSALISSERPTVDTFAGTKFALCAGICTKTLGKIIFDKAQIHTSPFKFDSFFCFCFCFSVFTWIEIFVRSMVHHDECVVFSCILKCL